MGRVLPQYSCQIHVGHVENVVSLNSLYYMQNISEQNGRFPPAHFCVYDTQNKISGNEIAALLNSLLTQTS